MPLLDHFRPPLSQKRHWHSFHNSWATYLAASLNQTIPAGYFAEANVQFDIEIDVATFEESSPATGLEATWKPRSPDRILTLPTATEVVEVLIRLDQPDMPRLAGAIELISPANKDRPSQRRIFIEKCLAYLEQGAGLILVDVVTSRSQNLHNQLLAEIESGAAAMNELLYATAYRSQSTERTQIEVWEHPLQLDQPLPTVPLWLSQEFVVPVDLEATYQITRQASRL